MKILAIETSCDETAIALVNVSTLTSSQDINFEIVAEIISSQIDAHRPFGGVVPSLAKREHLRNLPLVYEQVLKSQIPITNNQPTIDMIAVTVGPGLEPALWTGINFAKELAEKLGKPLVGVNHLEGHMYSNWLPRIQDSPKTIAFPAIVLVVSGGHTILVRMDDIKKWEKLGETQDDAVGEAFDKVAKMLGLPYPGGPEVERAAKQIQDTIHFPRPMLHSGDYNFSFSGLKTAVLYHLRGGQSSTPKSIGVSPQYIGEVCAAFQEAAIEVLVTKTMRAAEEYAARSVLLCGGVAANRALQAECRRKIQDSGISFFVPETRYNTDNAVMIAAAAHLGNHYSTDKALSNLNL